MPFRRCSIASPANRSHGHSGKNGLLANIFLNSRESYRGQWLDNQPHGYGTLMHHDTGSFYEGEFFQNKKHGHGRLTVRLNDGSLQRAYVGQWKNDQRNGYGTLYLNEAASYEGNFVDSQRCGYGRMQYENGDI